MEEFLSNLMAAVGPVAFLLALVVAAICGLIINKYFE